jgi:integrase
MPRKTTVRYFASRKAYYCQYNGKQHRLADGPDDSPAGPTYMAALEAFKQVMRVGSVTTAKDRNTVRVVLETYLQHAESRMRATTFKRRVSQFKLFCEECGETAVGDLTQFTVEAFCLKMRKPRHAEHRSYRWTDGSIRLFLTICSCAFNWAVKKKLITENPLQGMERPPGRSRSRECLVSPEQHRRILEKCTSRKLRPVIVCLENTGCRPGELTNATAADWDEHLQAIHYYSDDNRRDDEFRHKSAGRSKDRVIFFSGEALAIIKGLMAERPTGLLFTTRSGRPWTPSMLAMMFRIIAKRVGMPGLTAYSYRHSLATNWLKAEKSIDVLAEILGNTAATIRRHYAHLCGDRASIRRHFMEFRTAEETGMPSPAP